MADPIVIDNSAFAKPDFRRWLNTYYGQKIMPSVSYAEALVHVVNKGGTAEEFDELLRGLHVRVERTSRDHAALAAIAGSEHGDWRKTARDYLIGAHAESAPRVLVTENVKDFAHLPRVLNVWDAVNNNFSRV